MRRTVFVRAHGISTFRASIASFARALLCIHASLPRRKKRPDVPFHRASLVANHDSFEMIVIVLITPRGRRRIREQQRVFPIRNLPCRPYGKDETPQREEQTESVGRRVFGVRRVVHIDDVCSVDGGAAVSPGRVAREMRCICFLSEEENVLKTIKSNRVFTKTSSLCRRPKEGVRERKRQRRAQKRSSTFRR